MAVYFNDLTIVKNDPQQNCRLLPQFFKVMQKLCIATEKRENKIFAGNSAYSLAQAVYDSGDGDLIQKYFMLFKTPYQDEQASALMAQADEHTGAEAEYHLAIGDGDKCDMLGWAHHKRSITLGLESSPFWGRLVYPLERTMFEGDAIIDDVVESVCVTNEKQIETSRVQGWIVAQRDFEEIELPPVSSIPTAEKKIKYCDDHGREILDAFARRLVRCDYVDAIINSTPYRRQDGDQFIYDVREDGIVYVCLHWCEDRYGLVVQTTARGKLQTQLVADVLREKFDRKS